jgi:hypothetical protein
MDEDAIVQLMSSKTGVNRQRKTRKKQGTHEVIRVVAIVVGATVYLVKAVPASDAPSSCISMLSMAELGSDRQ